MDWLWWIAAALVLAVTEVFTLTFVLLMLAGGAIVAGLFAAFGAPVWVQLLVFALVAVILLLTLRRAFVNRFRHETPEHLTNAEALVGREAVALDAVTRTGGRVKLGGEVWTARVAATATQIPVGERVRVVRIDGATAVVEPLHLTSGGPSV